MVALGDDDWFRIIMILQCFGQEIQRLGLWRVRCGQASQNAVDLRTNGAEEHHNSFRCSDVVGIVVGRQSPEVGVDIFVLREKVLQSSLRRLCHFNPRRQFVVSW